MEIATQTAQLATVTNDLDKLIAAWLLQFGSENTRNAYGRDFRHFLTFCSDHDIEPLDAARPHVDAYARSLDVADFAPSTISRRISSVSSFYDYAEDLELIAKNPAAKVKRPKVSNTSTTFGPDRRQLAAIIDAAEEAGPRDLAVVLLLAFNGLRVSEAIALDAEDIETVRGHCTVQIKGKGGRVDRIPLPPRTCDALDALDVDSGPLLTDDTGKRLNRHQVTRIVARLARKAKVDGKATPHSLRHAAVTLALDAGVSLRDVQDMARHADPRTTRRYDRARNSLDRHASYAIAAHLASGEEEKPTVHGAPDTAHVSVAECPHGG